MSGRREVWITGVGLITCLGEGLEANWSQLERGDSPPYDDKSFAPYIVHPLPPINFEAMYQQRQSAKSKEADPTAATEGETVITKTMTVQ